MRPVLLFALMLAGCSGTKPRSAPTPDAARIVTDDLARFYAVFDALPATVDTADAVRRFEDGYFAPGSDGLRAFRLRTRDTETFTRAILDRRRFYSAIRSNVLSGDESFADSVRAVYRSLARVYPDARFPDVYLLVGRLSTGGTIGPAGLLIGAEHYALSDDTPLDELSDWQRNAVFPASDRLPLVVHELMHAQQHTRRRSSKMTLLEKAIAEGCADHATERLVGRHPNARIEAWTAGREAELWDDFVVNLDATDTDDWFYMMPDIAGQPDRPADVGYVVGLWICRAYTAGAVDQDQALRTIIEARDPYRIYEESGFQPAR